MLKWKTITPVTSPQFMVNGVELSAALAGEHSRFQIVEIRCRDDGGLADRSFAVHDAAAINDAQSRAGVRPPIVARFDDLDDATSFCERGGK